MFVSESSPVAPISDPFDTCVIGSGPAGMTLAIKLAQVGQRVALIEAGNLEYDDWSQSQYQGRVVGDPYYDLDNARLRMLGGSSNHWAGHCIPLEAEDFLPRADHPDTGWPITIDAVAPFLDEACDILEMPNDFADAPYTDTIRKTRFQWSPPVLFNEKYHDDIAQSSNLTTYLGSALIGVDHDGTRITSARLQRRGGEKFDLPARTFVICTGGIENSRLLLWINAQNNNSLIPNHDLIGRCWTEHPHAQLGEVLFEDLPDGFFHNDEATFSLTRARQDESGILNAALQVEQYSYSRTKKLVADIACVAPALGSRLFEALGKELVCGARLHGQWEQAPVAQNRVALASLDRDAYGIPRPQLHWQRSDTDRKTIAETVRLFAEDLARTGKGRVRMADWITEGRPIPDDGMMAIWHHMGGTRMDDDPARGITDKDLRVHGLENLYLGGSSVYPTGGYANPTLMIVQLSLRLAAHLTRA
ncbi:GMC family oxidoreductase [uncultured Aliiroseovarius sp.]|uniref:GMC oxidoreductase n=1 Tax=uncultured Aliiroseovarius sp. TaxID=1658783 RepID=UPI002597DC5F|nr:GMC family oxidoreductase [uncultured Aliiroseovarius sp.]